MLRGVPARLVVAGFWCVSSPWLLCVILVGLVGDGGDPAFRHWYSSLLLVYPSLVRYPVQDVSGALQGFCSKNVAALGLFKVCLERFACRKDVRAKWPRLDAVFALHLLRGSSVH